jgi:hypothetical protein
VADSPPISAAGREVRTRPDTPTRSRSGGVRTSLLAGLGAGDLALRRMAELSAGVRERLAPDEVRKRLDEVRGQARVTYAELAKRGEQTLRRRGIGARWMGEAKPVEPPKSAEKTAQADKPKPAPAEKRKPAPAASAKRTASARAVRTSAAKAKSAPASAGSTSAGSTGKTSPGGRRDR